MDDDIMGTVPLPGGRAFSISNGWALDQVIQIDDQAPGFLARVCRARLSWRQALWACLAAGGGSEPEVVFRATGDEGWLNAGSRQIRAKFGAIAPALSARDLTEMTFGKCPDGWLGALRKLQGQPFGQPEVYLRLFRLFVSDDPLDRRRRAALEQGSILDDDRLEAALALTDGGLMASGIIDNLRGREAAEKFQAKVEFVRRLCSWVSNDQIQEAVARDRRPRARPWMVAMLAGADRLFPETHPCDADPDLERFPIGKARDVGAHFHNCLDPDRLMPQALSGCWAMVIWRSANVLIETRMLEGGGWQVQRVHVPANRNVDRTTLLRVAEKLERVGVQCPVPAAPATVLDPVKDEFGGWDGGMSFPPFDLWD